jgi:hypothetical protein
MRAMFLALSISLTAVPSSTAQDLPGVGHSVTIDEIKVTLLGAERLAGEDLDTPHGRATAGLRIVWFVENRPGVPIPPVLGEVRVFTGSRQYNAVTNAASSKPFAPGIIIHGPPRFFASSKWAPLQKLVPAARPGAVRTVLEVLVFGASFDREAGAVGELEQGSSEGATLREGNVRFPPGQPIRYHWFRFALPRLTVR